jgi:hypothetical protein
VARIRRILRLVAGLVGFLVYVWVAAVRLLPEVKRRKSIRRARRARRVAEALREGTQRSEVG